MKRRTVLWLVMFLVLFAVIVLALLVRLPWYWRAAPASPNAGLPTAPRSSPVLYEVFQPMIDPINALIDYFRPSHLRQLYCAFLPEPMIPWGPQWCF